MNRRDMIVALACGLALPSGGALAQSDPLEAAFNALPEASRRKAQQDLAIAGFYAGAIDGAYGRGTANGLRQSAAFVAQNSRGKVVPQIDTAAGASAFVQALAAGELAKWLYGEGDENDM